MYRTMRPIILSLFCLACLGLTACPFPPKVYRMDVRQGNYLTADAVKKVKVGMTKQQIFEILGTPALTHFFEQERWDYYYYLKPGNDDPIVEKRLGIVFQNDKAIHIDHFEESK